MQKSKNNYIYVPTNMKFKGNGLKVIYRRKYLGATPKFLRYRIKKALYLHIMNYLRTKPVNNPAILNRAEAVILDKKYATVYTLIANRYDRFEEKYEKLASDGNFLSRILNTRGKINLGLALSLLLFLNNPLSLNEQEEILPTTTPEIENFSEDSIIEVTSRPKEIMPNITLNDLIIDRNLTAETMTYSKENLSTHFLSPEKQELFELYIKEYANYFNLNAEYLIDVFKQATDGYSNIDAILDSTRYDISNPETAAVLFTCFFYQGPKKYLGINITDYGYESTNEFVTSNDIYIIEPNWMHNHVENGSVKKEDITLRNGLEYSQYVGRISELVNVPDEYKPYILSVSYAERGQFGSPNSIYLNNMGGLRGTNGFYTYPSPEAGIICFVLNLRRYEFDYRIPNMQVFGNIYDGDDHVDQWVKNVNDNYQKIADNLDTYFLTDEEEYNYQVQNLKFVTENDNVYEYIQTKDPIKTLAYINNSESQ